MFLENSRGKKLKERCKCVTSGSAWVESDNITKIEITKAKDNAQMNRTGNVD